MYQIRVEPEYCKSCGFCTYFCRKDVLAVGNELNHLGYRYVEVVHPENCVGCLMCATMCGEGALTIEKEEAAV